MSTDRETSNRLSAALDEIFSRSRDDDAGDATAGEPGGPADEPYVLPEIVPATEEPAASAPTLPEREARPDDEPVRRPPQAEPTPTPQPDPARAAVARAATTVATTADTTAAATSWSDHMSAVPSNARSAGLRAPGRRPRVRRVTRVLRHVDPWSTFKVALLFSLVTYLVALTSGVLMWRVADSTGTLGNVERWFTQFGWETFELDGGEVFRNAWIIGLFGVVAMTGGLVLLATIFNLVSDIIGGVRLTVLEEEVVERTISSTRRYVVRQGSTAAGTAASPAQDWSVDDPDDPATTTSATPAATTAATGSRSPGAAVPAQDWSVDDD